MDDLRWSWAVPRSEYDITRAVPKARFRPGFFTFVGYCGAIAAGSPWILRISILIRVSAKAIGARTFFGAAVGMALACAVGGCSAIPEQATAVFSTSPGKYDMYGCDNIESQIKGLRLRRIELEQLMARASQGAGGAFISAIAYRTEYEQAGSDLKELGKATADKQCAVGSKFSSGRAVF
jgi:hypothetical protein